MLVTICCHAAKWDNPSLPMADADKPVYQWKGWPPPGNMWIGGKCNKVRIPSTEDMKKKLQYEFELRMQEESLKQVKRADNLMLFGLIGAIVCIVIHGCSSLPQLKRIAEYGIVGSVVSVIGGIGYKFLIKHEVALEWAFGISVLCGVAYWLLSHKNVRDWSISHIFKGKEK